MQRAVVSGSTGFVGASLLAQLRVPAVALHMGHDGWRADLDAVDLSGADVFHLAARVHLAAGQDEAWYQSDNVEKTRALAKRAARQGAHRFVYLSSIKVHGEETTGRPFVPADAYAPEDAYARSKRDAELALAEIAAREGLSTAVVRAPLVYGAGAPGNLAAILRLADSPYPLPFAALHNRRSFVYVDDLARLLIACAGSDAASGTALIAAHREAVSTSTLVRGIRRTLRRPARLFGVPAAVLETAARTVGQGERARRLTRSLEADPSLAETRLGWHAQVGPAAAIEQMALAWAAKRAP